jgi:calcineurin-like phosphoesterase
LTAILFVGDVVASTGRRVVRSMLADLRAELDADFVVVNGENASGGIGITPKHADELFAAGADVITLGNHTYRHRELWPYLEERRDILRPANFLPSQPGRGTAVVEREGRTPPLQPCSQPTKRYATSLMPTTCSWTSMPRQRARRSRSGGFSTAG